MAHKSLDARTSGSTVPAVGEALEPRRLLAAIEAGVLVARGTAGGDTISVRRTGSDDVIISTNGTNQQFDMDNFTGVRLEGLGGNDTFNLIDPLVSPVVRNTTVLGGAGSDTISYATRTAALSFLVDPNGDEGDALPGVTSGAQFDQNFGVETLIGGSGADTFAYRQFAEIDAQATTSFRFEGRGGNDMFEDRVFPSGTVAYGAVTMLGGDGDDNFRNDSDERFTREFFFGEAGNDTVTFFRSNTGALDGGSGTDTIIFDGSLTEENTLETMSLVGFTSFENAIKEFGTLIGTSGPNQLKIRSGGTLRGGGGNDTLIGSSEDDLLDGGDGNDLLVGNDGNDTLDGGAGTDTIDGGAGANTSLHGEVFAGQQPYIAIVERVLTAVGSASSENFSIERTGTDNVTVRIGALSREFDMDDFDGVSILGLGGNDVIAVKQAIVAGSLVRKVTIDGGGGNDSITGSSGDEVMRGNVGSDTLIGLGGRDALFGGGGNDHLFGGLGLDFLDGGDNDDFIDSSDSAGGDSVLGGNGSDTANVDAGDSVSAVEKFA